MPDENSETNLLELATELTIAWLSNPNTRASAEDSTRLKYTPADILGELCCNA